MACRKTWQTHSRNFICSSPCQLKVSVLARGMVQFHVVQSRPVPGPILLHDPLAEGVKPVASVVPCGDRPEMEQGDRRHDLRFVCRYSACNSGGLYFSFRKRTGRLYLPVESIIYAIAVSSFEAESVRLKALFTGPILIIVHIKNGIIKACTQCMACLLLLTSDATQQNVMEMSRNYKYLQFSEQLGWIHIA